ncbi:MAG TPA: patatin-like phospholipase family protein [Sunxiuqinia sp.]|nr:patatin-like phospholipase family protein [Sunxiuqinia sp.]
MTEPKTIRIGICMAGAVSAGAYTAGVIDYLFEALENWQKAKDLNLPGVPKHNVKIEVLTGASAGGMTAAMTSSAVQHSFKHINAENYKTPENTQNPVYDAWVNLTETEQQKMMDQMLANDDIDDLPTHEVRSLFNSKFIMEVASRIIDNTVWDPEAKRPYVADDLEILTTQTNLRGFDYALKFRTALGESVHRMTRHQDVAHFRVNQEGTYEGNGQIPLSYKTEKGVNKDLLKDAAIATGAFPVGLSPHQEKRDMRYILDNPFLNEGKSDMVLSGDKIYSCVNVDGGVINNEPFGLTDDILVRRRKEELERAGKKKEANNYIFEKSAEKFDTTLIMIDPFPSDQALKEDNEPLEAIKFAVPDLLNAMRQQLMFKEEELKNAYDEDNYSRFMVLPVRYDAGNKQEYALACGGLGGFAGFFKKEFREHDFMLGRRNCQLFLQRYFSVPEAKNNPILKFGYDGVDQFRVPSKDGKSYFLPIIPDMRVIEKPDGSAALQTAVPEERGIAYNSIKIMLSELLALEDKMQNRFGSVLENIMNGERKQKPQDQPSKVLARIRKKSGFQKWTGKVGGKLGKKLAVRQGRKIIATKFVDSVIREMETRGLLDVDC